MRPTFPITVRFAESGEAWVFDDEIDAAVNLEWFDSDDPEENAAVTDATGARVRLVIERLETKQIELI